MSVKCDKDVLWCFLSAHFLFILTYVLLLVRFCHLVASYWWICRNMFSKKEHKTENVIFGWEEKARHIKSKMKKNIRIKCNMSYEYAYIVRTGPALDTNVQNLSHSRWAFVVRTNCVWKRKFTKWYTIKIRYKNEFDGRPYATRGWNGYRFLSYSYANVRCIRRTKYQFVWY